MARRYTGIQSRAANLWQSDAQVHIASGPFQCGKTASMIDGFLTGALIRGGVYIIAAPTLDQANSTIVRHIQDNHPDAARKGAPGGTLELGGVEFQIRAGRTKGSHEKIKGKSLSGAFLDEITEIDPEFYRQAIGRCSLGVPGKLVATCNPDAPSHWVKTDIIDKADTDADTEHYAFTIDDNPALSEKFKAGLRKRYTGVWLDRYYYGKWVAAEGGVYPIVGQCAGKPPEGSEPYAVYIGADFGNRDPTHAVRIEAHERGVFYATREWRRSMDDGGHLTDEQKAKGILGELARGPVNGIWVDPSALGFIESLRRFTAIPVHGAPNSVTEGIQQVNALLELGRLKIDPEKCPETWREMNGYRWGANTIGETRPDHENSHSADAIRYFAAGVLRQEWWNSDGWD